MKSFFKSVVVNTLSYISRKTLQEYHPLIIAVTGNIGKTTTKDYIFNFLKNKFIEDGVLLVRASEKSQNSEFGVNLTILNEKNAWNNPLGWFKIIIKNYIKLFFVQKYPEILVLEIGADKPGDISYLTTIIQPDLVVLTAFQQSPTHGEFFLNVDQHINEKKVLVEKMHREGIIVYNSDDKVMTKMAQDRQKQVPSTKLYSFGYAETSNIRILENVFLYSDEAELIGQKIKYGINFENILEELEVRLTQVLGDAQAYSIGSAICVSILNGLNREDIISATKNLDNDVTISKSRMRLLNGINNTKILDDTYNSSPKAAENAIETVSKILNKGKKIAVLGHMAELGNKTEIEHFNIGLIASKTFDVIILSGKHNEYFLEGIRDGKFDLSKVYVANNSEEVLKIITENNLIKENDFILIKGSQSARLEKVVVQLLVNPRDRDKVCRQEKEWEKK